MIRFRDFLPLVAAVLVGTATLTTPTQAHAALQVDFSNTVGTSIVFNPTNPAPGLTGSFTFVNGSGGDTIQITDGTASGLTGDITGTYNIGAISSPFPGYQTATVTNATTGNQFIINDGSATFTANVDWINIFTAGASGGLNSDLTSGAVINLSNISYNGSNADLLTLAQSPLGTATISFQFTGTPPPSLTSLTTTGGSTSFSGSVSPNAVPEPSMVVLLMSAAPCLLVGRLVRRQKGREAKVA